MIQIADKDNDYKWVYTDDPEEFKFILQHFNVVMEDKYEGCSAVIVRKSKSKSK